MEMGLIKMECSSKLMEEIISMEMVLVLDRVRTTTTTMGWVIRMPLDIMIKCF
jgi:hypothetical protein